MIKFNRLCETKFYFFFTLIFVFLISNAFTETKIIGDSVVSSGKRSENIDILKIDPVMELGIKFPEVKVHSEYINGFKDNQKGMYVRSFEVPQSKALVILIHGIQEYAGRHNYTIEHLIKNNFSVIAYDLRGHGLSAGIRSYVENFDDYVGDLDLVIKWADTNFDYIQKKYIFAHSMGGLIAYRFATSDHVENKNVIDRYVLSSPALALKLGIMQKILLLGAKGLRHLNDKISVSSDITADKLTDDKEEQKRWQQEVDRKNPAVMNKKMTVNLGLELDRASRLSVGLAHKFDKKLLLMTAEVEAIVDNNGDAKVFSQIPGDEPNKKMIRILGSKHEISNSSPKVRSVFFENLINFYNE